jgi:hypothetical protein
MASSQIWEKDAHEFIFIEKAGKTLMGPGCPIP